MFSFLQKGPSNEEISEFYENYFARVERVMALENEQRECARDLIHWTMRYHNKSQIIRGLFETNKEELEKYIYPFIDGRLPMNHRLAECFVEEIYKARKEFREDSLVTLEIINVVLDFYRKNPPRSSEIYYTALGLKSVYEDNLGEDDHLETAIQYNSKIIHYNNEYDKLKLQSARDRMFFAHYNRVVCENNKSKPDVAKMMLYAKDAVEFYKKHQEDYGGMGFRLMDDSFTVAVFATLNLGKDKKAATESLVEEAIDKCLNRCKELRDNNEEVSLLLKIDEILSLYHRGDRSAGDSYYALADLFKNVERRVDYTNLYFHDEAIFNYTLNAAPEMLKLIELSDFNIEKKTTLQKQIAEVVFNIYGKIPFGQRNRSTNIYMLDAYKYVLPYYRINDGDMDELIRATVSRENLTSIHINMVMALVQEILKSIIMNKPQLLIGVGGFKNEREIRENVKTILKMGKVAAFCHDIGKIAMADLINIQYRPITETEFNVIKKHTIVGADLVRRVPELKDFADVALGHQLSYDGKTGYPVEFNKHESKQEFFIDLVRICDCIDAGTDQYGRVYKNFKSFEEILKELSAGAGTQYNPDIVYAIEEDETLAETLRFLTMEGRDTMLYSIYKMIQ